MPSADSRTFRRQRLTMALWGVSQEQPSSEGGRITFGFDREREDVRANTVFRQAGPLGTARVGAAPNLITVRFGDGSGRDRRGAARRPAPRLRCAEPQGRVGLGECWTPRELRHPCVSITSDNVVTIEQIADPVGHRTTIVTQKVYRHQLKPVISTGATAMNTIFGNKKTA
jgi:hypothetical protein